MDKPILTFMWESQGARTANTPMKDEIRGPTCPDFKTRKVTLIPTVWDWEKKGHTDDGMEEKVYTRTHVRRTTEF